jgi:hypothetical protein
LIGLRDPRTYPVAKERLDRGETAIFLKTSSRDPDIERVQQEFKRVQEFDRKVENKYEHLDSA